QSSAPAEHRLFHLLRDDRTDLAEILADLLHLACGAKEEFEIGGEGTARAVGRLGRFPEAGSDEVVNIDLRSLLAGTIVSAIALFQAVWVPWDLVMYQAMAMALQIDALARRIGRQEDPDRRFLRVELESGLDALAIDGVLGAEEKFEAAPFLESAHGQL